MNIRNGRICAAMLLSAFALCTPAAADAGNGIGTWEGVGTVVEVKGKDVGSFSVRVTRKALGPGKVRADGIVTLANGQHLDFWQEFEEAGSHGCRIVSTHGKGGGRCFANGMCQTYEQTPDGHAFATTLAPDGTNRLRVLITELEKGEPIRFYQQTLTKKQ